MGKNIGKNISKNLRGKYSQKLLDYPKQSPIDAFKTASKRAIQKIAEATGDLIGEKLQINLETFKKNHNKAIQTQLQMRMIKKATKK